MTEGKLPDALILGAVRSGTTALYNYLTWHSDVQDNEHKKELKYYTTEYNRGLDWYKSFFDTDKFCLEGTPQYLYNPRAPELIRQDLPEARFIALLRDPVERAWSHFVMHRRNTDYVKGRPLEEYVATRRGKTIVESSVYTPQIKRWLNYVDKAQLLLIKSEKFFQDTATVYLQVLDFLGLEDYEPDNFPVINDIEKPPIPDETHWFLEERYRGEYERLLRLVNQEGLNYIGEG